MTADEQTAAEIANELLDLLDFSRADELRERIEKELAAARLAGWEAMNRENKDVIACARRYVYQELRLIPPGVEGIVAHSRELKARHISLINAVNVLNATPEYALDMEIEAEARDLLAAEIVRQP